MRDPRDTHGEPMGLPWDFHGPSMEMGLVDQWETHGTPMGDQPTQVSGVNTERKVTDMAPRKQSGLPLRSKYLEYVATKLSTIAIEQIRCFWLAGHPWIHSPLLREELLHPLPNHYGSSTPMDGSPRKLLTAQLHRTQVDFFEKRHASDPGRDVACERTTGAEQQRV